MRKVLFALILLVPVVIQDTPTHATGTDPVIGAAGDIACDPGSLKFNGGDGVKNACRMKDTSNLLINEGVTSVLTLGDNQYTDGALEKFYASYDPSWGREISITYPSVGNHEYKTTGAAGYFTYFGSAGRPTGTKGYYSFDLLTGDGVTSWHFIALNSNCGRVGGCAVGSKEYTWLVSDLAASPTTCTLAFWHHPRFSSGYVGSNATYQDFWQALYDAHADVVLNGHDHDYERFAPQDPTGLADANGIREFVVGTGGSSNHGFATIEPNSEFRQLPSHFGVLFLTLHPTSYDWTYQKLSGAVVDSGSASCVT